MGSQAGTSEFAEQGLSDVVLRRTCFSFVFCVAIDFSSFSALSDPIWRL
jgi:hypothetical protein